MANFNKPKSLKPVTFSSFWIDYIESRIGEITGKVGSLATVTSKGAGDIKNSLVRNMYWGRTSFYKKFFHVLILAITIIALYTGFGSRITVEQKNTLASVQLAQRVDNNSDIINQQGKPFSISEYGQQDSVFEFYTVVSGDSLAGISEKFGRTTQTLRWANNIPNDKDTITPGQILKIPDANGVLYTVKEGDTITSIFSKVKTGNPEADILTFKELNRNAIDFESDKLIVGREVLLYEASIPIPTPTPRKNVPRPTTNNNNTGGGGGGFSLPAGKFTNPMQQANYSFARGWKRGHTGVDLTASTGSWVVAAAGGTVTRSGWCASLGYCIVIVHSGGASTIYGHSNGVFAVRAGQSVSAGQRIMQVGCTGNCSGSHLHLSLAVNGNDVYGCYSCRINPAGIIPY